MKQPHRSYKYAALIEPGGADEAESQIAGLANAYNLSATQMKFLLLRLLVAAPHYTLDDAHQTIKDNVKKAKKNKKGYETRLQKKEAAELLRKLPKFTAPKQPCTLNPDYRCMKPANSTQHLERKTNKPLPNKIIARPVEERGIIGHQ